MLNPVTFALGWHRAFQGLIVLALGSIAALGQPPQHLWALTLVSFAGLFAVVSQAKGPLQAALWLWLFGTGHFAVALRWIVEPFFVDAARHGWMAPFAIVLLAAGLALFWALAGALAVWLRADAAGRTAALVVSLSLAEMARGTVLTGFPWAGVAQTLVDSPFDLWLALLGPYGCGALMLACAGGLSALRLPRFAKALAAFPFLVAFAVHYAATRTATFVMSDAPVIRVVQPNAPQDEKWDPALQPTFLWRQIEATSAPGAPALTVWPETAIPGFLRNSETVLARVSEAARGRPVVLGAFGSDGRRVYNTMAVIGSNGAVLSRYDKHHLVPFGEYMPLPGLFRRLGISAIAERVDTGMSPGPGPRLIDVPGVGFALPLICYEAVFPQHARTDGDRPRLLLQITNDAWFGTYAGPQQHLAQARMRAIEQGLPLVRSANTGISAIIDARGDVIEAVPIGVYGFADAPLPPALAPTFYARMGDGPVLLFLLAVVAVLRLPRKPRVLL